MVTVRCRHLVLDHSRDVVLDRRPRRSVLQQGHRVGAEAQRRSLDLEHQLVDSKASTPPHVLSGFGHRNHLDQENKINVKYRATLSYLYIYIDILIKKKPLYDMTCTVSLTTHLTVHSFATCVRDDVRTPVYRKPDGPGDGPGQRVVHAD